MLGILEELQGHWTAGRQEATGQEPGKVRAGDRSCQWHHREAESTDSSQGCEEGKLVRGFHRPALILREGPHRLPCSGFLPTW